MVSTRDKLVDSILLFGICASVGLALLAFFGSGVYRTVYGIRLSSQTLWRPAIAGVLCSGLLLYRSESRQRRLEQMWGRVLQRSMGVALLLAVATVAIAIRLTAFEVYAADTYGYVSQAHLWAAGSLVQRQPLALSAPWPEPEWTLAPLGYRAGIERGTIVPIYSPGLPLVMSGLRVLFGAAGPFFAVPFLGGIAVLAAFILGRRVAGEACGLAAATLLLTSPIFLYQLKEPMSDVPVTAWWLIAIVLISTTAPPVLFAAGLATSAAILTRPNLVPLAAVLGIFVLAYSANTIRGRLVRASAFSAGVIPGCIGVALFNDRLYGSPLSSGYGEMSGLFDPQYFLPNAFRYAEWLLHSETLFILLAVPGFVLLRQRERLRWSHLFAAFAATLYGCYAIYLPFDNWTFLRFLLPAIPLLLVLCSLSLLAISARLPSFIARFVLAACFVGFLAWRWDVTGLKPVRPHDRRFAVIGDYVHDHLPPNAIVISMIHSGSVRYYSGRLTLRWDWMAPEWFDRSLAFLTSQGYRPYLLIEEWERRQFAERFSGVSSTAALGFTPIATYYGGTRADLYDLADPHRRTASATITARAQRVAH